MEANSIRRAARAAAILLAGAPVLACSAADDSSATEAPGTGDVYVTERRSTDGVDSVVIRSGAMWESPPTLVEALSIGEEQGAEPYLFGAITGAWATDDRIYVIDAQVPVVRAFDRRGTHVGDIGRPGQGPGEYAQPAGMIVTDDGTVAVADAVGARINLYDRNGGLLADRPLRAAKSALGLTLGTDGRLYTRVWDVESERMGVQAVGADGPTGDVRFPPSIDHTPPSVSLGKGLAMAVPFAPLQTWAYGPGGEFVAGVGDRYELIVHDRDDRVMRVERYWQPVPVAAAEASFQATIATASLRQTAPDLSISADDIPAHKPAFRDLHVDRSGRLWVTRQGRGRLDTECADVAPPRLLLSNPNGTTIEMDGKPGPGSAGALAAPCWADTLILDVFAVASGDFYGTISATAPGFRELLFAEGETVLATVMDQRGTLRLKVYELRLD